MAVGKTGPGAGLCLVSHGLCRQDEDTGLTRRFLSGTGTPSSVEEGESSVRHWGEDTEWPVWLLPQRLSLELGVAQVLRNLLSERRVLIGAAAGQLREALLLLGGPETLPRFQHKRIGCPVGGPGCS